MAATTSRDHNNKDNITSKMTVLPKRVVYVKNVDVNTPKEQMQSLTILTDKIEVANILCLIHSEFVRATVLHPEWPKDNPSRYSILAEEFGEIAKAINENDPENIKEELIQTAAMCLRMLLVIGGGNG